MGTLGNQKPFEKHIFLDRHIEERAEEFKLMAKKTGVEIDVLVKIELSMNLDRVVSVLAQIGDNSDENLAGIGNLLERLDK